MNSASKELDFLLADVQNPESYSKLIAIVYDELRRIAAHYFKNERADHTLQPTALVHEVFIRLYDHGPDRYENRAHFFAVAARAMRQILIEYSRSHKSGKRKGAWEIVPLKDTDLLRADAPDYRTLAELLDRLEEFDERACRVVELRVFGGLTSQEIADVLRIGESTARKDWTEAKMWLESELQRSTS